MHLELATPHHGGYARIWLAVGCVALFFTHLDGYAFATHRGPPPVRWIYLITATAGLLLILEPRRPRALLRSPVLAWVLFYFLLTSLWGIWASGVPEVTQLLYDRYRSIATVLAFAIIFDDPRAQRVATPAIAAAVVIASVLNLAEMASFVTFADIEGLPRVAGVRPSGFYINPNGAGMAIALGLAATADRLPDRWRAPIVLIGAVGVTATFSRSAMILVAMVFAWLVWRRRLRIGGMTLIGAFPVILFVYGALFIQSHFIVTDEAVARLRFTQDDSGRVSIAMKAWENFMNAPWVGNGIGSTVVWDEPVGAHNMFAALASDHGVLGLLAFPALALALVSGNRRGQAFALVLMAAGFFSHNLLEDPITLLLIALVGTSRCLSDEGAAKFESDAACLA